MNHYQQEWLHGQIAGPSPGGGFSGLGHRGGRLRGQTSHEGLQL